MGDWEDRGRRWGRTVVTFALVASTAHMATGADAARRQKERTSMPVEFDKFGPEWVLALLAGTALALVLVIALWGPIS